jgi:hypothetical protein
VINPKSVWTQVHADGADKKKNQRHLHEPLLLEIKKTNSPLKD